MPTSILKTEPFIDLEDGKPVLSIWLSDMGPLEEEVVEFIGNFLIADGTTEEVVLDIRIDLSAILYKMIDGHRLIAFPDKIVMGKSIEPLITSIHADLLKLVATIDTIQYVED